MQALERILAILEAVSRASGDEVAAARVAEETSLSLSTVVRLMQSLVEQEVLLRSNTSGHYSVGPRLIAIVGRSTRSFDSRVAVRPILEQLRASSYGETCTLHVREGQRRVCVAAANTAFSTGRIVPVGLPLPLVGSAVGHALLSQMSPSGLDALVDEIGLGPAASDDLRQKVDRVRTLGYSDTVNDSVEGVRGVAVPVGSAEEGGVLCVSGPSDRFREEHVLDVVDHLHHAADLLLGTGIKPAEMRAV